ncbi:MAG TPA: aminotransferase class I/II-fold pyridoxal phosphate-dependent enzyme [Dehalococcoidia bacterium]|nr:aminotransferase class I/II-fold pyridoxal phosphate-dependent enzyme [Dehalococcoidia bacterium]
MVKPYGRQLVDDDVESVVNVLRSEYITQGQKVEEFGTAIAQYCGADYAIAVSSGTAALELAIKSLEIGPGDEVITTPITFCATANAVMNNGSDIRLVDIEESTLNINPEMLEAAITKRTKAILPVDFRGHPASLPEISRIATKFGLYVIQDASHSLGSSYYHQGANHQCGDGCHSDITTFSFHPVKHITSGEGGAVVTNDTVIAEKVRALRSHGVVKGNMMQIGTITYPDEISIKLASTE